MSRLNTPQLKEALKNYPLYSQDGKGKEAICCAVFVLGRIRWFILEGSDEDGDTIMFGIVIGLQEDEYGYVSLNELSEIEIDLTSKGLGKYRVTQLPNYRPRPIGELNDIRLKRFLAKFKDTDKEDE